MSIGKTEIFSNFSSDEILNDIATCRVKSAAGVMIKLEILGRKPDAHFMTSIMGMFTFSPDTSRNAFEILGGLIDRGHYVDVFREERVMSCLISYLKTSNFLEAKTANAYSQAILRKIANRRPGLIIRYYINNGKMFRPTKNAYNESLAFFEEFTLSLSNKIANANPEYGSKYHVKVRSIYESNWILQNQMR